jgi:hypothetical protein
MTVVYIISCEFAVVYIYSCVPSIRKTSQNRSIKSSSKVTAVAGVYCVYTDWKKKKKFLPFCVVIRDLPAMVSKYRDDGWYNDFTLRRRCGDVVRDGTANRTKTTERHCETRVCRTAQRDRLACGRHTA